MVYCARYIKVKGIIANPIDRSIRMEIEFVVDTGAIYTMIPESVARRLELKETGKRKFKIANGETVEYPVSEAYIILEGRGVTSLVVVGSEKVTPLLGVTTLELLGFEVDPITRKLKPIELMILGFN